MAPTLFPPPAAASQPQQSIYNILSEEANDRRFRVMSMSCQETAHAAVLGAGGSSPASNRHSGTIPQKSFIVERKDCIN